MTSYEEWSSEFGFVFLGTATTDEHPPPEDVYDEVCRAFAETERSSAVREWLGRNRVELYVTFDVPNGPYKRKRTSYHRNQRRLLASIWVNIDLVRGLTGEAATAHATALRHEGLERIGKRLSLGPP